jgi:hypothetical protein
MILFIPPYAGKKEKQQKPEGREEKKVDDAEKKQKGTADFPLPKKEQGYGKNGKAKNFHQHQFGESHAPGKGFQSPGQGIAVHSLKKDQPDDHNPEHKGEVIGKIGQVFHPETVELFPEEIGYQKGRQNYQAVQNHENVGYKSPAAPVHPFCLQGSSVTELTGLFFFSLIKQ